MPGRQGNGPLSGGGGGFGGGGWGGGGGYRGGWGGGWGGGYRGGWGRPSFGLGGWGFRPRFYGGGWGFPFFGGGFRPGCGCLTPLLFMLIVAAAISGLAGIRSLIESDSPNNASSSLYATVSNTSADLFRQSLSVPAQPANH